MRDFTSVDIITDVKRNYQSFNIGCVNNRCEKYIHISLTHSLSLKSNFTPSSSLLLRHIPPSSHPLHPRHTPPSLASFIPANLRRGFSTPRHCSPSRLLHLVFSPTRLFHLLCSLSRFLHLRPSVLPPFPAMSLLSPCKFFPLLFSLPPLLFSFLQTLIFFAHIPAVLNPEFEAG